MKRILIIVLLAGITMAVLGSTALALAPDTDLSNAGASFWGEDSDDYSGVSVSGAGDVNGDGFDDLLIGANGDDDGGDNAGQTYLILGSPTAVWGMDYDLSFADASFRGEDAYDLSGGSVSGAGDVNGDGFDDILIGASGNSDGDTLVGQTYLILGSPTAAWGMDFDLSSADASFLGEEAFDQSGESVSGAGDVNGDGFDDILIGTSMDEDGGSMAGQTYLILGSGTPNYWGMDFDLSNADASFLGEAAWDYSGFSVSGAGDVNGDGFDDIIIGAYGNDDGGSHAGQTYLILGSGTPNYWGMDFDLSSADASFLGENIDDYSGESVSGIGDVNGDGFDDIIIGAYGNDDGEGDAGQTYLILGSGTPNYWGMDFDLSSADASFLGEDFGDLSGWSVSGAGDVNGDAYGDFLIGAWQDEDGGTWAGQTYLILGSPTAAWGMDFGLSNADASFWGEDTGDHSGESVSGAGDVNGDGFDDILIGAEMDEDGGDMAGQTYLIIPAADMDVQGLGFSILDGDTTPSVTDDTDFGAVYHNIGSVDHVFTIENTGWANLDLTHTHLVVVGGTDMADFTIPIIKKGFPIAYGGTKVFTVHFDPSAEGIRSAFISIPNNDPDEDPYNFNIQGVGIPCSGESSDDAAVIKDEYLPDDIVYVTGSGFTPLANVQITVVADLAWTDGMTIPADITDEGINQVMVTLGGTIPLTQIWAPPLPAGEYDIVFNVVRQTDTTYDIGPDDVDDPNHPGFIVRVPVGDSGPTVGGQVMLANKFELLTQYLNLPMRLIMGFAF